MTSDQRPAASGLQENHHHVPGYHWYFTTNQQISHNSIKKFQMKFAFSTLALLASAAYGLKSSEIESVIDFDAFTEIFGRAYENAEVRRERRAIFEENVRQIVSQNERYANGLSTFQAGVNQFTDMTNEVRAPNLCGESWAPF